MCITYLFVHVIHSTDCVVYFNKRAIYLKEKRRKDKKET